MKDVSLWQRCLLLKTMLILTAFGTIYQFELLALSAAGCAALSHVAGCWTRLISSFAYFCLPRFLTLFAVCNNLLCIHRVMQILNLLFQVISHLNIIRRDYQLLLRAVLELWSVKVGLS